MNPGSSAIKLPRFRADLLLVFTAAIWGLAFVFQKTAMGAIEPCTFIAARSLLAATALVPLAWLEARRSADRLDRQTFSRIVLSGGVAFFLGAVFQQMGLVTASVTNTGFLTALYVVLVPFVAWTWHGKLPARIVWPAATLSFVGTWLLGGGSLGAFNRGDLLVAICALFWAVHVVVTGSASALNRPVTFTCLQFAVVALFGLIGASLFESPSIAGLKAAWIEIAYVGLLSSALTFTLLAVAMKHTPPSEAAIIVSTESLFGALAGALLLGERLGWVSWLGAALILAAVAMVQLIPASNERRT